MPHVTTVSTTTADLTIRLATSQDTDALAHLAALDSARPPAAPVLLAERDGRAYAALSLFDGRAVADPFEPTADLVELLRLRAVALRDAARPTVPAHHRLRGLAARRRPAAVAR